MKTRISTSSSSIQLRVILDHDHLDRSSTTHTGQFVQDDVPLVRIAEYTCQQDNCHRQVAVLLPWIAIVPRITEYPRGTAALIMTGRMGCAFAVNPMFTSVFFGIRAPSYRETYRALSAQTAVLPLVRRSFRLPASMAAGEQEGAVANLPVKDKKETKSARPRRPKKSSDSEALKKALEKYEPVIGVEVHVQLATKTKAYCACSTRAAKTPNSNICPVCMGYPGALPVLNRRAVQLAAQAGMALNCDVSPSSRFDRKNYYYVDTAKNYQITQQHHPIAERGFLELATSGKRIAITRLHMEEDSAKMSHEGTKQSGGRLAESTYSLVDFNRAGVPLIEVVSEADIRSGVEAAEYGQELQRILRYIRASDCNMQDGSLRCDVNVSLRRKGDSTFGTKVELKNLNSFGSVQKSIEFEIERQAAILDDDGEVVQETRSWDEKKNKTATMRVKEGSADYRYFPEPDLPPLLISEDKMAQWRSLLPELPSERRARYMEKLGLSEYDAFLLTDDLRVASYFEEAVQRGATPKTCANWIMGDITKVLKAQKIDITECKLVPEHLAELVRLIEDGIINNKIAKDLIPELVVSGGSPAEIVKDRWVSVFA